MNDKDMANLVNAKKLIEKADHILNEVWSRNPEVRTDRMNDAVILLDRSRGKLNSEIALHEQAEYEKEDQPK